MSDPLPVCPPGTEFHPMTGWSPWLARQIGRLPWWDVRAGATVSSLFWDTSQGKLTLAHPLDPAFLPMVGAMLAHLPEGGWTQCRPLGGQIMVNGDGPGGWREPGVVQIPRGPGVGMYPGQTEEDIYYGMQPPGVPLVPPIEVGPQTGGEIVSDASRAITGGVVVVPPGGGGTGGVPMVPYTPGPVMVRKAWRTQYGTTYQIGKRTFIYQDVRGYVKKYTTPSTITLNMRNPKMRDVVRVEKSIRSIAKGVRPLVNRVYPSRTSGKKKKK